MSTFPKLDDNFAVTPQINEDVIQAAAQAGYQAIICNRPDNEEPGQPQAEVLSKAATRAGLAFHQVPFDMGSLDKGVIDAVAAAIDSCEGPVLAYCRTGTRSTIAWCVIQRRAGAPMNDVLQSAQNAGYALAPQAPMIDALV